MNKTGKFKQKKFLFTERIYKMEEKKLPEYELPSVVTYTDEEILEELVRHRPMRSKRPMHQNMHMEVLAS
ncbi:MAG: hypothetical protein HUU09_11365 [Candidatus Jettenia caeni]|uniref:hypothetical protein n=1 Tax=Candidatus Jettenia sp. AMX1 TaxID=2293637 RepID=UPI0017DF203C|nr:hypothetical protein [Candidatus Jettenia sp. AMX1]MDL1939203.1 hypothetical protein [Candidatus Jettenia sp. AMX1]NUN24044.1 hypothetical protein [Candidatus Jettenia caeni]